MVERNLIFILSINILISQINGASIYGNYNKEPLRTKSYGVQTFTNKAYETTNSQKIAEPILQTKNAYNIPQDTTKITNNIETTQATVAYDVPVETTTVTYYEETTPATVAYDVPVETTTVSYYEETTSAPVAYDVPVETTTVSYYEETTSAPVAYDVPVETTTVTYYEETTPATVAYDVPVETTTVTYYEETTPATVVFDIPVKTTTMYKSNSIPSLDVVLQTTEKYDVPKNYEFIEIETTTRITTTLSYDHSNENVYNYETSSTPYVFVEEPTTKLYTNSYSESIYEETTPATVAYDVPVETTTVTYYEETTPATVAYDVPVETTTVSYYEETTSAPVANDVPTYASLAQQSLSYGSY